MYFSTLNYTDEESGRGKAGARFFPFRNPTLISFIIAEISLHLSQGSSYHGRERKQKTAALNALQKIRSGSSLIVNPGSASKSREEYSEEN